MKAQELEKIKAKEELASCTFKPQILNYKNAKSTTNLVQKKEYTLYDQAKKEIEMKPCTFNPKLNRKSEKIL